MSQEDYEDIFIENGTLICFYHKPTKTMVSRWQGLPLTEVTYIVKFITTDPRAKETHLVLVDNLEGEVISKMRLGNPCATMFPYFLDNFASVTIVAASAYMQNALDALAKETPSSSRMKTSGNIKYDMLIKSRLFLYPDGYNEPIYNEPSPEIDRHFVALNGAPRFYRAKILEDMIGNGYEDKLYYSWVIRHHSPGDRILAFYRWNHFDPNIPKYLDMDNNEIISRYEEVPLEYNKAAIDIVTETNCDVPFANDVFITEKTWKPILREKMFLCFNGPNYYKELQDEGFRLYDKLFDYSFDSIIDHVERYNAFMENIYRIAEMPLEDVIELIKSHEEDLRYNKHHALQIKGDLPDILAPHIDYLPYLHKFKELRRKGHIELGQLFRQLPNLNYLEKNQCIVEIGSDRWEGSTKFFASLAKEKNIPFYTVDMVEGIKDRLLQYVEEDVFSHTEFFVKEGCEWTYLYDGPKIHILYLDNFDWDWGATDKEERKLYEALAEQYANAGQYLSNENSILTHLRQMINLLPSMADDCYVVIDDTYRNDPGFMWAGKGAAVIPYLQAHGFKVINEGTRNTNIGVIMARGRYLETNDDNTETGTQ